MNAVSSQSGLNSEYQNKLFLVIVGTRSTPQTWYNSMSEDAVTENKRAW